MDLFVALEGVWIGLTGAVVGSFLNVVIYRLPQKKSIVKPRSMCPACGKQIAWYDNIPVFSYFILRGKCRNCKAAFSIRYAAVEALAAAVAVGLWWRFGMSLALAVHFVFAASLIAITFIDIDHRIIPNVISLPGIILAFLCSFLWPGFWRDSLIGLLAGGGGLLVLSLMYSLIRRREGMGMGDVKLLAMLGAWLGWQCLPFVLLFASIQGVLATIIMVMVGVKLKPPLPDEEEEETEEAQQQSQGSLEEQAETPFLSAAIPFGPFLSLAAFEYLFLAEWFYGLLRGGVF